jgi:hypothetical protein
MKLKLLKNPKDSDIVKCLKIYVDNIKHDWLTNTNEMVYWQANYNKMFNDKLYFFGIYDDNKKLIGYLQFVHFISDKIIFIDYIAIDEKSRKNNTFGKVVVLIHEFIKINKLDFDYILCEVDAPVENARNLERLYNRYAFKKFDIEYYSPSLSSEYEEIDEEPMKYALMVYSNKTEVSKYDFLNIIDCVFFKHYKRWYDEFTSKDQIKVYNYHLNTLISKLIVCIENKGEKNVKII